jgi:dienelactone hydrolase
MTSPAGLAATLLLPLLVLVAHEPAAAEVRTRDVEFTHGATIIRGVIAWNDQVGGRRPGVLIVHGGWGYSDNVRQQARRLAESGYVGYAFDMHGMGAVATHHEHGGSAGRDLDENPALMATRFMMAVEQLKADPHVDSAKISAIGYCWGGAVVLNMARAGADLDAVITFSGILDTKMPARRNQIRPRLLILTGELDSRAPRESREAFTREMTDAGAKFEMVIYPGAQHAFTQPYARDANLQGIAYDGDADRKSWAAMLKLLEETYR